MHRVHQHSAMAPVDLTVLIETWMAIKIFYKTLPALSMNVNKKKVVECCVPYQRLFNDCSFLLAMPFEMMYLKLYQYAKRLCLPSPIFSLVRRVLSLGLWLAGVIWARLRESPRGGGLGCTLNTSTPGLETGCSRPTRLLSSQ